VHAVDGFPLTRLSIIVQGVRKVAVHQAAVYRDRPRMLNELKIAITAHIRNISQADLQKVFANKIKWDQACVDAHGHHNTFCKCTATFQTPCTLLSVAPSRYFNIAVPFNNTFALFCTICYSLFTVVPHSSVPKRTNFGMHSSAN
jgi:hypothetical protein